MSDVARPVTGLFEILTPVLGPIDGLMGALPELARLVIWGIVAGALSMWFYTLVSPQGRLKSITDEVKELRKTLGRREAASEKEGMHRLALLSLQRIGVTLGPAVLSSLPMLFLLGFLNGSYALSDPPDGDSVAILLDEPANIQVEGGQQFASGWTVSWPEKGEMVPIKDKSGRLLLTITNETRPGVAARPDLMTRLFGAPAGRLPEDTDVSYFVIESTPPDILMPKVGTPWAWMLPFFLALVVASMAIKTIFRIQ